MGVGTIASYCNAYSGVLGSESYAIGAGDSLAQQLFEFRRERYAQPAARGSTHSELSAFDPIIERPGPNPEAGRDLLHTQLARREQSRRFNLVGISHPTHSTGVEAPSGSGLEAGTVEFASAN